MKINIKQLIAKRLKPKTLDDFDEQEFHGKIPRKASIYYKGKYDSSNAPGHGMRKEQGVTNYIDYMSKAEKEGKFKLK